MSLGPGPLPEIMDGHIEVLCDWVVRNPEGVINWMCPNHALYRGERLKGNLIDYFCGVHINLVESGQYKYLHPYKEK